MKSLIVTVAGTATRFNRDTEEETLKCIYYKEDSKFTLLYQILDKSRSYDEFIIVGGFLYDKLEKFISENFKEFENKIKLIYNPHFKDYGSGYSLIKGIEALDNGSEEVLFVEGDLYVDDNSFKSILQSHMDTITINREAILSNKAVALYEDERHHIHYIYDSSHSSLNIPEPFLAIYNSGQIWKFIDVKYLREIADSLSEKQIRGTNLEIVQGYFESKSMKDIHVQMFEQWFNCNTVFDYEQVYNIIKTR